MDQPDEDEDYGRQEYVATEPNRAPAKECRCRHSRREIVEMPSFISSKWGDVDRKCEVWLIVVSWQETRRERVAALWFTVFGGCLGSTGQTCDRRRSVVCNHTVLGRTGIVQWVLQLEYLLHNSSR